MYTKKKLSVYCYWIKLLVTLTLFLLPAPTGAPTVVSGDAITSNELEYTGTVFAKSRISYFWSPPTCGERNGEITGYTYSLRRRVIIAGPPLDMEYNNVFTNGTRNVPRGIVHFHNLAPDVDYTFEIAAHNAIGVGPMFTANTHTPAGRKLFGNILLCSRLCGLYIIRSTTCSPNMMYARSIAYVHCVIHNSKRAVNCSET